jgi:protein-tyrosine phosphatase
MQQADRVLALEGARNLRDLGGFPTLDRRVTRWRTLFRSDSTHRFTPAAQECLVQLGVRTIIDLREIDETSAHPSVFLESTQVSYCWRPFWGKSLPQGSAPDIQRGYIGELDECGQRLAAISRELVEPAALPALVHCASGKDRTGVFVALLLAVARVPRSTIVDDYVLTRTCLGEQYLIDCRRWVAERGGVWEDYAYLFDTPPERMESTLDHLDRRWGGADQYLLAHGLSHEEVERLRELLTAPDC